jgi:hypothetical protein
MRINTKLPHYFIVTVLFVALLGSCEEKPDFIGGDLLPSADDFVVLFDSTEVIYGYTKPADSLISGYKETFLLGSVEDMFFGRSKAEIVTTIGASVNSRGFGENAKEDSVVLLLALGEKVGEGSLPMQLKLYEFNEFIRPDSAYFTNMDISGLYREDVLGSTTIQHGDTVVRLHITDREFIDKFLTAPDSVLDITAYLQEYIKGLYLTTNDPVDGGNIFKIDFDDVRNYLYFYYSNDSSTGQSQYYSFVSQLNRRINLFNHDHAGYPLEQHLNTGSVNDSLLFVQSMAGVSSIIRFPGLTRWLDSMPIAINEARIIFPVADSAIQGGNENFLPDQLNLYTIQKDGRYSLIYDQSLSSATFGGAYDDEERTYSFTIKVHMQSVLEDSAKNLDMVLIPNNTGTEVNRGILYGWTPDPRKRIRLEIIYTIL